MKPEDGETRLRALLAEAGVDAKAPTAADVATAWEVWRAFAADPAEGVDPEEGDGILAQYGVYEWEPGERFLEIGMTRQFAFLDAEGEYDHMTQLECTFKFEPAEELAASEADDLWSFDHTLEEFFAQALAMPGFQAVAGHQPLELEISYEEV